jgi:hypothetical protein
MMLQSPPEALEKFFQQFFPWMMDLYKNYQEGKFSMPGMPTMPGMPSMPFQNPWMQMPNPFQAMNPFMQTPTAAQQQRPEQTQPNKSSDKKSESSGEKSDDKMAEILKRLRELEEKLHSD